MRRCLLIAVALPLLPLLAACGGGSTPALARPAAHDIDVGTSSWCAFKKQTGIPNCPAVTPAGVDGGMPAVTLPCLGGGRASTWPGCAAR